MRIDGNDVQPQYIFVPFYSSINIVDWQLNMVYILYKIIHAGFISFAAIKQIIFPLLHLLRLTRKKDSFLHFRKQQYHTPDIFP